MLMVNEFDLNHSQIASALRNPEHKREAGEGSMSSGS